MSTRTRQPETPTSVKKQRRTEILSPRSKGPHVPLNVVSDVSTKAAFPSIYNMPEAEINRRYEEWMKIVADNKINSNNTWNLFLIDYFHDLRIFRDGDSINFQKASCTLDGCVKIFSSRVDSVATEADRLLGDLATSEEETKSKKSKKENNIDNSDSENDDDDEITEGNEESTKSKNRAANTLVKPENMESLNLKEYDLEFAVDPLFRKMSAEFDEGGAKGLLLNHLNVYGDCRLVFDSSDASLAQQFVEQPDELCDFTRIRALLSPYMDRLHELKICPTFHDFKFEQWNGFSDTKSNLVDLNNAIHLDVHTEDEQEFEFHMEEPSIHFMSDNDDLNVDGPMNQPFDDDGEDGTEINDLAIGDEDEDDVAIDDSVAFGLSSQQETLKSSGDSSVFLHSRQFPSLNNEYSYFDESFAKSRSEHWKLSNVAKKHQPIFQKEVKDVRKVAPKEKTSSMVDFLSAATSSSIDLKQLFQVGTAIYLPKSEEPEIIDGKLIDKYVLPAESSFSSRHLFTLFSKPLFKFTLDNLSDNQPRYDGIYSHIRWITAQPTAFRFDMDHRIGENRQDVSGLSQQQQQQQQRQNHGSLSIEDMDDDDNEFFVDNDEGGQFMTDDASESDKALPSSGNTATSTDSKKSESDLGELATIKKVERVQIGYAKVAKRVDVRKLKENLWTLLTLSDQGQQTEKVQGIKTLSVLMRQLNAFYPEHILKDISVSFCFICVLHLANEKHLKILNVGTALADLSIQQDE